MKTQEPTFSTQISNICNLFITAQREYTWNKDKVYELEALTQDYLHKLELDNLSYKDRAKVATQLAKCRQDRRKHKDQVQLLEPLVQYLDSDKGRQLYNLMREVLGKTRKVEEHMENRRYIPRVLTE